MLGLDDVAAFLCDRGLIDASWVPEGDLTIRRLPGRNRVYQVIGPGALGYHIKQPNACAERSLDSLRREAAFNRCFRDDVTIGGVRSLIPRLVHFEHEETILVFELIPGAISLWNAIERHGLGGVTMAALRDFGVLLGTFHRSWAQPNTGPPMEWLPSQIPSAITIHKPDIARLAFLSAAEYEVLCILQAEDQLQRRLEGLRCEWAATSVIHGDIRFDNVLFRSGATEELFGPVETWLADWEMVTYGDPAWDVGGALQDLLVFWVSSMPIFNESSAEAMIAGASVTMDELRSAARSFWHGYRLGSGHDPDEANELVRKSVAFSAARLIQSAFEWSMAASRPTGQSVVLLQLATNVLAEPERAQLQLYGIPLS
jgi:hypothetical protein